MEKMRLLVIDDDPAFTLDLRGVLDRIGLSEPDCTATATEAMGLLCRGLRFDGILLDLGLRGGAAALCRRIRLLPEHVPTPILGILGQGEAAEWSEAAAAGLLGHVSRRLDPEALRQALGTAAEQGRAQRQATDAARKLCALAAESPGDPVPVVGLRHVLDLDSFGARLHDGPPDRSALAFRVGNATAFAAVSTPVQYQDMLFHVAAVLADRLEALGPILTHAGQGEFAALLDAPLPITPQKLARELFERLADRGLIYDRLGLPRPVLQVGKPMRRGFLRPSAPSVLLARSRRTLLRAASLPGIAV